MFAFQSGYRPDAQMLQSPKFELFNPCLPSSDAKLRRRPFLTGIMATIIINSQKSSHTRGTKRKRASGIKFDASNVSAEAISVQNRDEEYLSDAVGSQGSVCEQSDTCMGDASISPKKRRRVQEAPVASKPTSRSMQKKYKCSFKGCEKAYTKPTRLEEHKRSHTGERPFKCVHPECKNAYLRESHLQAHARTHRAYSERGFVCSEGNCERRFWTSTQLNIHKNTHDGELKPFKCVEVDCSEAFLKHHQLRAHFASAHCPPGTKSFRCDHEACSKSFSTSQKLKAHSKLHQSDRYVCVTEHCLTDPQYFQTWSLLQAHIRIVHPPTCPHPGCEDKTFASQKNFKAHLKVHEERDIQESLEDAMDCDKPRDETEGLSRRTIEVGRDWKCEWDGCEKAFKSKKAMNVHINVSHREQRDFKCDHAECERAFGYKHLLQRHMAKIHGVHSEGHDSSEESAAQDSARSIKRKKKVSKQPIIVEAPFIEALTGKAYKRRGEVSNPSNASAKSLPQTKVSRKVIRCPWPHFSHRNSESDGVESDSHMQGHCEAIFHRAYDLRRHLKADHALIVEKAELAAWLARSP